MTRSTPEWREYYRSRYKKKREKLLNIKSDRLCECGCGEYTGVAIKTNTKLGIKKGDPLRFLPNHNTAHLRAEETVKKRADSNKSLESRIKKSQGGLKRYGKNRETVLSPFVPGLIVRYNTKSGYWNCRLKKEGKTIGTHHAKAVWEYYNGPVPSGYEVHHINNKHSDLQDDCPTNLIAIPREWNRDFIPTLIKGLGVECKDITEAYLEGVAEDLNGPCLFKYVVFKVLRIPN